MLCVQNDDNHPAILGEQPTGQKGSSVDHNDPQSLVDYQLQDSVHAEMLKKRNEIQD